MITGAGRAFCAGQDLKGRTPEQKGSLGASLREKYNPMIRQLRQMETIVIAAVNGVAAGAGSILPWPAICASRPKKRNLFSPSCASAWHRTPAAVLS